MNKLLSAFYALALTTTIAHVGNVEADTSVQFGIGYRSDDINWKIHGTDEIDEDNFSHLNFRDLEIFTIQGKIKSVCGDCVYYRLDGQYGWVEDGRVRESNQFVVCCDPCHDTKTIAKTRTHNDVKRDYVADFNIGVGYPIQNCMCPEVQIIPMIGFAYDTQRLRVKNHDNCCDHLDSENIDSIGLKPECDHHSKHRATWWGPYVGLDFAICHQDTWNIYGEFEYHFGVRARRERNSDVGLECFDSHKRTRRAQGVSLKIGSAYSFSCNWFADAFVTFKRFWADEHRDRLTWRSIGVGLDIGYIF